MGRGKTRAALEKELAEAIAERDRLRRLVLDHEAKRFHSEVGMPYFRQLHIRRARKRSALLATSVVADRRRVDADHLVTTILQIKTAWSGEDCLSDRRAVERYLKNPRRNRLGCSASAGRPREAHQEDAQTPRPIPEKIK